MVPRRRARIAAQRWFAVGVGALVLLVVLAGGARGASYWTPSQTSTFQWELDSPIDQTADAQVYDVDLFTTDASVVSSLHAQGRHVICYLDAGSWENWRPDAGKFPKSVLGNTYAGYPDERWLDVRQLSILEPIMTARIQLCHDKGFDGVEFDNIDGWQNNTGFPLTSQDSITYDEWLASTAHSYNLNAAMKSDLDQVTQLEPYFDWNLDEECFDYSECTKLLPFIADHKAVLEVEYNKAVGKFCSKANGYGFMAMRKTEALTAWRAPCWATGNWVGRTGSDGYDEAAFASGGADLSSMPNASVTLTQGTRTVWAATTTDIRALQSPGQSTRAAAAWSSPTAVKLNITFSAPYTGDLHLYAVDWDSTARREKISVGSQTSSLLTKGNFGQGEWVSFPISATTGQTIAITVTRTAGASAVLSGLFLSDDLEVSSSPQGNWAGNTGSSGYVLAGFDGLQDRTTLPNASVSLLQGSRTTWAASTTDPRALESPDESTRAAAAWSDPVETTAQLTFTTGFSGYLHLYALDWNASGRRETVTVGSQTVSLSSDFSQGAWIVVPISVPAGGTLPITITRQAGPSAVLSGLFLGNG